MSAPNVTVGPVTVGEWSVSATGEVGDRRGGTALRNKHGVACDHGAGTSSLQR